VATDSRLSDLCEAYEIAFTAAEYWLRSDAKMGRSTAREFEKIASEIEGEILTNLI
jgi:hypothetical protein